MEIRLKSVLAGVCITMGGKVYITMLVLGNKALGAVLFSVGLLTIIIYQLHLFTGKVGYVKAGEYKNTITIWIYNLVGCILAGIGIYQISTDSQLELIETIVNSKLNNSIINTFILAIFCGALMFIAVDGYRKTKQMIIPIICVVVFILSGYEHCIANMGYTVIWITEQIKLGQTVDILNVITKLLTTTIGNAVGAIAVRKIVTLE